MSHMRLSGASLDNVLFTQCDLTSMQAEKANMDSVVFAQCDCNGGQFNQSRLNQCFFEKKKQKITKQNIQNAPIKKRQEENYPKRQS
eukprot:TRINITY_DN63102_c0_g1_i1.p2 TRINITY_DN63102_c0_g1~~TRINITY_DN63102_c0_g1_i1.p2  ORF type:complete len:102 (-),score=5.01 TRINITY_DN63102_c0_g1_i1:40-300(-)